MKKSMIIWGVFLFVFALAVFITALMLSPAFSGNATKGNSEPILLTEENFPAYLQGTLTPDLPKNSKISVSIANKDYALTGKSIESTDASNPDVSIVIPESYLNKEYDGICDLLRDVVANGDVLIDTSLSKAELFWKYKKLRKYWVCFE